MERLIYDKCKWFNVKVYDFFLANRDGILLLSELILFITSIYSMCRIVILLGLFCRKSRGFKLVVT